jgi:hypothetical protein
VQRTYIQERARVLGSEEYVTSSEDQEIELSDIASDIYRIVRVVGIDEILVHLPLLRPADYKTAGIRVTADRVFCQGIASGRTLEFHYERLLRDLGGGFGEVREPQIDGRWHELYALGAATLLHQQAGVVNEPLTRLFYERLDALGKDRNRHITRKRTPRLRW